MLTRKVIVLGFALLIAGAALAQTDAPPKPPVPQKLRFSREILIRQLASYVDPVYPEDAQKQGRGGEVVLEVAVNNKGNVSRAVALQGDPLLRQAAMDTVKQWKYKPLLLNGQPVELESTVAIDFDPAIAAQSANKSSRLHLSSAQAAANCKRCDGPSYPWGG